MPIKKKFLIRKIDKLNEPSTSKSVYPPLFSDPQNWPHQNLHRVHTQVNRSHLINTPIF